MADDVLGEPLEVLAGFLEIRFDLVHLLAVFVDVEEGNAADADLQQPLDVGVRQIANHLFAERLEALVHGRQDGLVGFALLDFLVNALFDEDAFEGAEMEFFLELGLLEFEFALEDIDELGGVFAQNLRHGQSRPGRLFLMTMIRLEMVTSQSVKA